MYGNWDRVCFVSHIHPLFKSTIITPVIVFWWVLLLVSYLFLAITLMRYVLPCFLLYYLRNFYHCSDLKWKVGSSSLNRKCKTIYKYIIYKCIKFFWKCFVVWLYLPVLEVCGMNTRKLLIRSVHFFLLY